PISPVGLNWVMGDISVIQSTLSQEWQLSNPVLSETFQGRSDPQILLYSEVETEQADQILNEAANVLNKIQDETGIAYPFRDLQIVLLRDDFWETKAYGAGTIYLFENRGDLISQVRRSVISQWFGAKLRERQWTDADAILMLQAWQLFRNNSIPDTSRNTPEPYNTFDASELGPWIAFFNSEADMAIWNSKLMDVVNQLFLEGTYTLSYNELAKAIYTISGRSYFDGIQLPEPVAVQSDSIHSYRVDVSPDPENGTVQIHLQSVLDPLQELVNVTVHIETLTGEISEQITFTGDDDRVILTVRDPIENLTLDVQNSDNVQLDVYKPFQYWIYQLQNAEDSERRVKAAEKLSGFSDNPDLQLALTDIIQREENVSVQSQILQTLSQVTKGASGTEQFFLQRLNNSYPDSIRIASIESLSAYPNNDQVVSRLRSVLYEADSGIVRRAAIETLFQVTEPDAFLNIMENVITEERALEEVPFILNKIAEKERQEAAIRFAETFITDNFPYQVRKGVLDLLFEYDRSQEDWTNRVQSLLFDKDPRIRFYSADALKLINQEEAESLQNLRLSEEYDERVRRKLQGTSR
ncbi:MAG: HEAT repeat domain-containing protein, partial [Balneolaceae bacterium]|nr:HEAT repeat domain-containing protein [Balneolaceae bacterium]